MKTTGEAKMKANKKKIKGSKALVTQGTTLGSATYM